MVLKLVPNRPDNMTVAVLREALDLARQGILVGVSMSLWQRGRGEDHVCTGPYQDRPAEAVRAAMRTTMILTKLEDEKR